MSDKAVLTEGKERVGELSPGVHLRVKGKTRNFNQAQRRFALFPSYPIQRTEKQKSCVLNS